MPERECISVMLPLQKGESFGHQAPSPSPVRAYLYFQPFFPRRSSEVSVLSSPGFVAKEPLKEGVIGETSHILNEQVVEG